MVNVFVAVYGFEAFAQGQCHKFAVKNYQVLLKQM